MKPHTLPVKRRPVPKGILKRLSAVTGNRKQRVAAAAEMDEDDNSSKISRALTIIFLIHIVAIALIFVHQKFLDGRSPDAASAIPKEKKILPEVASPQRRTDLPRLSTGETPYIVRQGDNYARISIDLGVDEGDLRLLNQHVEIIPGLILKVPAKRPAEAPASMAQNSGAKTLPRENPSGLVDAVDVSDAPRAQLVRPASNGNTPAASAASGKSYVVKQGDSVWRIANRFKVNQDALMKANGISDARKMKVGMNLVIP